MMATLIDSPDALRRAGEEQFRLSGWVETAPFEDLLQMQIDSAEQGRA